VGRVLGAQRERAQHLVLQLLLHPQVVRVLPFAFAWRQLQRGPSCWGSGQTALNLRRVAPAAAVGGVLSRIASGREELRTRYLVLSQRRRVPVTMIVLQKQMRSIFLSQQ
jgi:hypothetical protein